MIKQYFHILIVACIFCLTVFSASAHQISLSDSITQEVRMVKDVTPSKAQLALLDNKLKTYPNPITKGGLLTVEVPSNRGEITLFMYNTVGKIIQTFKTSDKKIEINVPETTGIYLLRFVEKQKVFAVEKIVVKE